jgi:hypothetical protein
MTNKIINHFNQFVTQVILSKQPTTKSWITYRYKRELDIISSIIPHEDGLTYSLLSNLQVLLKKRSSFLLLP